MHAQLLSCVRLFGTPRTIANQAPLSMEFSKQDYWGGFPFPSPEDLPNPGIEPGSPALAGGFFTTEPPGKLLTGHWVEGTRRAGETWTRRGRKMSVCCSYHCCCCLVANSCLTLLQPHGLAHQALLPRGFPRQEY